VNAERENDVSLQDLRAGMDIMRGRSGQNPRRWGNKEYGSGNLFP